RGHNIAKGDITPGWLEVLNREGVRFDINRDHPLIKMFKQSLSKDQQSSFDSVLNAIENTFPAEALYSRMASDIRAISNEENIENKLQQMLISIFSTTEMDKTIKMNFIKNLHLIEPFKKNIEIKKKNVTKKESNRN